MGGPRSKWVSPGTPGPIAGATAGGNPPSGSVDSLEDPFICVLFWVASTVLEPFIYLVFRLELIIPEPLIELVFGATPYRPKANTIVSSGTSFSCSWVRYIAMTTSCTMYSKKRDAESAMKRRWTLTSALSSHPPSSLTSPVLRRLAPRTSQPGVGQHAG